MLVGFTNVAKALRMTSKRELTESEWIIIHEVWKHEPCAAPTVQEELLKSKNWSYSTVRTFMDRMVAKGLLKSEKLRNLTLYRSAISPGEAQKVEVLSTLKNAFRGALRPMVQCLLETDDLSAQELGELEVLLKQKRKNLQK